jgi:SAM-dependent methyltransferase
VNDPPAHGHSHAHPTKRQLNEAAVYDARAREWAEQLDETELVLTRERPPYPNREHVEFLDFMFGRIGDPVSLRVLEVGCGSGALATYLGMRGADVVGLDVSAEMLAVGRRRAYVNGVGDRVTFVDSPIESYDAVDASFDVVIGNQTLHHLELADAMRNIRRMLRPGGQALFAEPVLLLPEVARKVRNSTIVRRRFPERTDTPDERSLGQAEIAAIRSVFPSSELHPFQLLCRLQNFFEIDDKQFRRLEALDRALLRRVRPARTLCRYVVVVLETDNAATSAAKGAVA